MNLKNRVDQLHQKLFSWWRECGRVLPWREKVVSSLASKILLSGDNKQGVSRERNKRYDIRNTKSASAAVSPEISNLQFSNFQTNSVRDEAFESYFSFDSKRDPYRVIVSEIMLQQTQVDRVLSKYQAWMSKWPSIEDVAKVSLGEVIIEWKGLGYNRRARFLWLLAKEIAENRAGIWPMTESELLKLPGIGRYTARAIMSFSFGQQVGVVDTNVRRILYRIFNSQCTSLSSGQANFQTTSEREYFNLADSILPPNLADPWNQALMDFGALICTAKKPKCEICPVLEVCEANIEAVNQRYKNYSEKLLLIDKKEKNNTHVNSGKDFKNGKKIPFEQTDRFLRGRIIDELRLKSFKKGELVHLLHLKFSQFDTDRILENMNQLVREDMSTRDDNGNYSLK